MVLPSHSPLKRYVSIANIRPRKHPRRTPSPKFAVLMGVAEIDSLDQETERERERRTHRQTERELNI